MTSDLQQTRYDKTVRRVGGIIGPGAKVSEALAELFPIIDMENLPAELLLLGGTRIGFGGGFVGAGVGLTGRGQIENPVGSQQIVTVTQAMLAIESNAIVRWGLRVSPGLGAISTQLARDTRVTGATNTVAVIHSGNTAALANATGQSYTTARVPFILKDPNDIAVLAPGTIFEIGTNVINQNMNFTFYWREREALASETDLNV